MKRQSILVLVVLLTTSTAEGDLYEFTGNADYYGMAIKSYTNGNLAGAWSGSFGHNMPAQGQSLWDVDMGSMQTTMYNLYANITSRMVLSDTTNGIPFVLTLNEFSSQDNTYKGPYSIANDLTFSMSNDVITAQNMIIQAAGTITMDGVQYDFALNVNPDAMNDEIIGQFDDSDWPTHLDLRLDSYNRFRWGGNTYHKILETTIGGDVIEFYANPHVFEINEWTGQFVPVPSAFILGSIGITFTGWLLRRRKML